MCIARAKNVSATAVRRPTAADLAARIGGLTLACNLRQPANGRWQKRGTPPRTK